jgi:hypothetical protein
MKYRGIKEKTMPNVSEMQRETEEYEELLTKITTGNHSKKTKETLLRKARQLEKKLGIDGRSYNSTQFAKLDKAK